MKKKNPPKSQKKEKANYPLLSRSFLEISEKKKMPNIVIDDD